MISNSPVHALGQIKSTNLNTVFFLILQNQPISRAKIAQLCDLSIVTVSSCADYLLDKQVIIEIGIGESMRGRPPVLLKINDKAGVLVSIYEEQAETHVMIADLNAQVLAERILPPTENDPSVFLEQVHTQLCAISEAYRTWPRGIIGVSLAHRGHYSEADRCVPPNARYRVDWMSDAYSEQLREATCGLPVYTHSLRDAAALGELHYSKTNPSEIFACVYGASGIAVGVYLGEYGNTENPIFYTRFSHLVINFNGRKCDCGMRGCLVQYASPVALCAKLYPEQRFTNELFCQVCARYRENDPQVVAAVCEFVDYLCMGIMGVVNTFHPAKICLSGLFPLIVDDAQLSRIRSYVKTCLAADACFSEPYIYCSELKATSIAYGCFYQVRNHIVDILDDNNNSILLKY